MATNTVNISLPDPLKAFVEARIAEGEFGTPAEYIRALIRDDRERSRERLESRLTDALQTREIEISAEELDGSSLLDLLKEKLARP